MHLIDITMGEMFKILTEVTKKRTISGGKNNIDFAISTLQSGHANIGGGVALPLLYKEADWEPSGERKGKEEER